MRRPMMWKMGATMWIIPWPSSGRGRLVGLCLIWRVEPERWPFAWRNKVFRSQGCFLFGTRNPSPRNLFEARYAEPQKYTLPDGRHYVVTEHQEYDPITQIQHYTFLNQWLHPDGQQEEKTLRSALRYVFPQEMEALLFYNGFETRSCYGSWQQEPLTSTS